MKLIVVALSFAAAVGAAGAVQDPRAAAPHAYTEQFENDQVRVTRVRYRPNETLGEHAHPSLPSVFLYLNDGPAIAFKHQHGDSGSYAATRPPTKAGAYRLAAGRAETHIVENRSDTPSEFLQIEIKIPMDTKTFSGRRFREPADAATNFSRVEFENEQIRITRIGCVDAAGCPNMTASQALVIATTTGETRWIARPIHDLVTPGEFVVIGFK
jgi:hypothetical protein